jgi:hypothetical protein
MTLAPLLSIYVISCLKVGFVRSELPNLALVLLNESTLCQNVLLYLNNLNKTLLPSNQGSKMYLRSNDKPLCQMVLQTLETLNYVPLDLK